MRVQHYSGRRMPLFSKYFRSLYNRVRGIAHTALGFLERGVFKMACNLCYLRVVETPNRIRNRQQSRLMLSRQGCCMHSTRPARLDPTHGAIL